MAVTLYRQVGRRRGTAVSDGQSRTRVPTDHSLWPTFRAVDSPHNTPHVLIFNAKAFGWSKPATGIGLLGDSRDHLPPTARAVPVLRRAR